jgi:hypothetical protein
MLVPAFLWGTYAEVKPRARRFVKAFASGDHWAMLEPVLDTDTTRGVLAPDSRSPYKKEQSQGLDPTRADCT